MSANTTKKTQSQRLSLYKSGFVSAAVNTALGTNAFISIVDIDVSKLDTSKLEIFAYGHNLTGTQDFATIPNQGTLALINLANVLLAAWKLTGNILSIGYVNPNPGFTPTAPFTTVYLSYFVFTY